MKISASIYSDPSKSIDRIINDLDLAHVDYFHIDCLDDDSVFDDIKEIRKRSKTPIDLHIISKDPVKYISLLEYNPVELVSFQIEDLPSKFVFPKNSGIKLGIAIKNETSLEKVIEYVNEITFIMLMTTVPGKSGGTFDVNTYDRIRTVKKLFPSKKIHIDGGVNDKVSKELLALGVDCSVSGSFLVKSDQIPVSLLKLRDDMQKLDFLVEEVALKPNEVPRIDLNSLTLKTILQAMNASKMSFAIIVKGEEFHGVITDGDLRRAMLESIDDLNNICVGTIINESPMTIDPSKSVMDAMSLISISKKKISFLPVIDSKKKFLGVVSVLELLKGVR